MAQNAYAVALVTLKVGVLKWTKEEIRELDVATRKLFTLPDLFHRAGDVDRLYGHRSKEGRALGSITILYEIRIVGIMRHFQQPEDQHSLLFEY